MDNKVKAWWQAHRPTKRRLIQVYAALLHNAHLKGFVEGEIYTGPIKNLCAPGFNCYSCPGAIGACPLGALQNALASSGARAPWYVLGILMLFGLTLGRTICGWLCPLGLIQELLHKLPTPKLKKSRFTRALSWLKYVILAVFVVYIPLVYSAQSFPVPGFCKYICPAGTLEGAMGLLSNPVNASKFSMLGILFTCKFIILVLILLACVFVYRGFCRFLCPLGAIYGLFARLSLLGVKVEAAKCTDCGRCVSQCKMDIRRVGDHECIHCGECVTACPAKAIQWRCGSIRLAPNEESTQASGKKLGKARAVIAWICALAVLGGVMWYVNRSASVREEPVEITAPVQDDTPVGKDEGMRCPEFTVTLYSAADERFSVSDYTGKPVIINFWATWCTPCVAELPHFQAIWDQYGDQIGLVAIHSHLVTDNVQSFLDKESFTMPFGQDADGSVITSLGGSTMLPMTVVLDANGHIVYNKVGSITLELLESLLKPLFPERPKASGSVSSREGNSSKTKQTSIPNAYPGWRFAYRLCYAAALLGVLPCMHMVMMDMAHVMYVVHWMMVMMAMMMPGEQGKDTAEQDHIEQGTKNPANHTERKQNQIHKHHCCPPFLGTVLSYHSGQRRSR